MMRNFAPVFAAVAAGLVAGLWHFRSLWHEAQGFAAGTGWLTVLWLRGSRYLATLALLVVAARWGGAALLAALAGWLLARQIALRKAARAAPRNVPDAAQQTSQGSGEGGL